MASCLSFTSISPNLHYRRHHLIFRQNHCQKAHKLRCCSKSPTNNSSANNEESESENVLLKIAWYGSEFLGIAASFLRSPAKSEDAGAGVELGVDGFGKLDRAAVVENIKEDFRRSYFVTGKIGNLAVDAYEEDCEFADPAGSFRGLSSGGGRGGPTWALAPPFLKKKIFYKDKGIGHWRFSCVMTFPWKPILSATGYTEYYFDEKSGKVCRHVEHWNVPKMALLKQILRPSKGLGDKKTGSGT